MDGQHTNRGGPLYWLGRRSRRIWIIVLALLPVLYVASIGPAFHLAAWLGSSGFMVVYEPIESLARDFDPGWEMLMWYLELWGIHIDC